MSVLNKTHRRGRSKDNKDPYVEDRKGGEVKSFKMSKEELEAYLKQPKEINRRK